MQLKNIKTAAEAIEAAGLNWKVEKRDLLFRGMDDLKTYDGSKAIVRVDKEEVLGIVSNRYKTIQNAEVFSFLDGFVNDGDVYYKAAHSYKGGRVISVDLSLTREAHHEIRLGDTVETLIRVITSHDGSEKLQARLVMNRLVCLNGMVRPHTAYAFNVKHTKNASYAMDNAREVLNVARLFGSQMADYARRMVSTTITRQAAEAYVNRVLDIKDPKEIETKTLNKRNEILSLGIRGLGNNGASLWDFYNGVTEYADHHINTRGENDRLTSSVLGSGLQLKERAYSIASEFIAA